MAEQSTNVDATAKPPTGPIVRSFNAIAKGIAKADDWINALTGFGIQGLDKRKSTSYSRAVFLDEIQLEDMYRGDGFAKRIVELPTREMMREGFEIKGDQDRKIMAMFEQRGILNSVANMIRWSRLFGGSIGVIGIQDGGNIMMPVNEKAIKAIEFIHVFDRWRVTWTTADLYNDPTQKKFGTPQFYRVSPVHGARPFVVHETRVIRLDGAPVPDRARIENQGWGDSAIQCAYEQIRALGGVTGATEAIMDDFITGVLGMKNLSDHLAAGNKDFLKDRINSMDLSRSVLNTTVIDAEWETFEKKASSVAGIPDILDRFAMFLSAVTGIPQTLLMGRSPAGMNSTGDSDSRNWYDQVAQDQRDLLNPIMERLVHLSFISKELGGQEPKDWKIEWNPLWAPSITEEATAEKTEAEEMDIYVQMGAMDPNEVREIIRNRFNLVGNAPEPKDTTGVDPFADPNADPNATKPAAAA